MASLAATAMPIHSVADRERSEMRTAWLISMPAIVLTIAFVILPVIAVVVMLVVGFALRSFRGGRELYAIGSNPDAANLAGIRVGRRVIAAFVISGALAGLAGVLWAARFGTIDAIGC